MTMYEITELKFYLIKVGINLISITGKQLIGMVYFIIFH